MAKMVLYCHAKNGQVDALIHAARDLATDPLFDEHGIQLAVMTPCSADLLAVPPDSTFLACLDLVIELVLPYGYIFAAMQDRLLAAAAPVMVLVDGKQSHLVLGYHRTFQESGSKPVRYHYLMYRKAGYSRADYLDYYIHSHYQFGLATPLADYYQNYLDQPGGREWAERIGVQPLDADNISELRFNDVAAYLSSDAIRDVGPAAAADEKLFVNRRRCQSFTMDVVLDTRVYP
jgi:hypothetical protein